MRILTCNASYLDVRLKAGKAWQLNCPPGQTRGFVYPRSGSIKIAGIDVEKEQLALLAESTDDLVVTAKEDTQFVVAINKPWAYCIVQHHGQMHTNRKSLDLSTQHIRALTR